MFPMPDDIACSSSADATVQPISNSIISFTENNILCLQPTLVMQSSHIHLHQEKFLDDMLNTNQSSFSQAPGTKWCRNCSMPAKPIRLHLCQINFEEAIYLCIQQNCQYPLLESNLSDFIVPRNISQLCKIQTKRKNDLQASHGEMSVGDSVYNSIVSTTSIDYVSKPFVNPTSLVNAFPDDLLDDILQSCATESQENSSVETCESVPFSQADVCSYDLGKHAGSMNLTCSSTSEQTISNVSELELMDEQNRGSSDMSFHRDLKNDPDVLLPSPQKPDSNVLCTTAKDEHLVEKAVEHARIEVATDAGSSQIAIDSGTDVSDEDSSNLSSDEHPGKLSSSKSDLPSTSNDAFLQVKPTMLSFPPRLQVMLQFQNKNNSCWLDVLLQCMLNTATVRAGLNLNLDCEQGKGLFARLCNVYDKCQMEQVHLSDLGAIESVSARLARMRDYMLQSLVARHSLKPGDNQSAMEMFSHLLKMDATLPPLFTVTVRWEFQCNHCQHFRARRVKTEIVSFLSKMSSFHPLNALFDRLCSSCNAKNQQMNMIMERIPPCLMMHFQQGLPHNRLSALDFGVHGQLYSVCAVVQYMTEPVHHFIVWIRDCKANKWICYDDLKTSRCSWQSKPPKIHPKQIHMVMWEKQGLQTTHYSKDHPDDQLLQHLKDVINEEVLLSDEEILKEDHDDVQPVVIEDDAEDERQPNKNNNNNSKVGASEEQDETVALGGPSVTSKEVVMDCTPCIENVSHAKDNSLRSDKKENGRSCWKLSSAKSATEGENGELSQLKTLPSFKCSISERSKSESSDDMPIIRCRKRPHRRPLYNITTDDETRRSESPEPKYRGTRELDNCVAEKKICDDQISDVSIAEPQSDSFQVVDSSRDRDETVEDFLVSAVNSSSFAISDVGSHPLFVHQPVVVLQDVTKSDCAIDRSLDTKTNHLIVPCDAAIVASDKESVLDSCAGTKNSSGSVGERNITSFDVSSSDRSCDQPVLSPVRPVKGQSGRTALSAYIDSSDDNTETTTNEDVDSASRSQNKVTKNRTSDDELTSNLDSIKWHVQTNTLIVDPWSIGPKTRNSDANLVSANLDVSMAVSVPGNRKGTKLSSDGMLPPLRGEDSCCRKEPQAEKPNAALCASSKTSRSENSAKLYPVKSSDQLTFVEDTTCGETLSAVVPNDLQSSAKPSSFESVATTPSQTSTNSCFVTAKASAVNFAQFQSNLDPSLALRRAPQAASSVVQLPTYNSPYLSLSRNLGPEHQLSLIGNSRTEVASPVDFQKLTVTPIKKSKLLGTGCLYDSYKPKRSFRLAGYEKKSLKTKKRDRFPRATTRQPTSTFSRGNPLGSCGSSDKSSDISDVTDLFPDFEGLSCYSDESLTSASLSSCDLRSAKASPDNASNRTTPDLGGSFLNNVVASNLPSSYLSSNHNSSQAFASDSGIDFVSRVDDSCSSSPVVDVLSNSNHFNGSDSSFDFFSLLD